jgi:hypothetical protein
VAGNPVLRNVRDRISELKTKGTSTPRHLTAIHLQSLFLLRPAADPKQLLIQSSLMIPRPTCQRIRARMTTEDDQIKRFIPANLHQTSCRVAIEVISRTTGLRGSSCNDGFPSFLWAQGMLRRGCRWAIVRILENGILSVRCPHRDGGGFSLLANRGHPSCRVRAQPLGSTKEWRVDALCEDDARLW